MALVLAREVGKLLRTNGLTISVAESCTGGRLGDALTNVSGSSEYFLGGVISYSNSAKMTLLNVRRATLDTKGAVSDETARQMAIGVRRCLGADIGVGITGVAGPKGGSPAKPVGLVHIAVSSSRHTISSRHLFEGTRSQIKKQSTDKALEMVASFIRKRYGLPVDG